MEKILKLKWLIVLIFSCFLVSCASYFVRKDCEKINWFQHGFDVAMSGKRLSGDSEIEKCRQAEFDLPESQLDQGFKAGMSNYCLPEVVLKTGKEGQFFNPDLCDHGQVNGLKAKHAEGVSFYCSVGNAYHAGTSGRAYQNICPPQLEPAFLPEYKRGRKKYLTARVQQTQGELSQIERNLTQLERSRLNLSYRMNLLPQPKQIKEKVYNSATGVSQESSRTEDPAAIERRRLNGEINGIEAQIQSENEKQSRLQNQISDWQKELATLD